MSNNLNIPQKEEGINTDELAIFQNMLNIFGNQVNKIQSNYNRLSEGKFS